MIKIKFFLTCVVSAFTLLACSDDSNSSGSENTPKTGARIKVFETSDIHGYIIDATGGKEETFQYRLAYLAKIFDDARASSEYDDVLLLDGGDIYQGAPVSNLTKGAVMRAAMDVMDYDAVSLGNHEFDWGVQEYATDKDGTLPAYEIGDFSGDPEIPVLAANLYYSDTHKRVGFTKDYVVVEKAGYRIALIGYIPDYTDDIMRKMVEPYEIKADLDAFSKRVREIKEAEKPDVTIVVAHERPTDVANGLSPKDVDFVTGGHRHDGIYGVADNGIPYIQCNYYAQGYATATIIIDSEGKVTVEDLMYTPITENTKSLYDTPENAENFNKQVLKLSHAAWDAISDEMEEYLGYIDASFGKKDTVGGHTASGGNFITGMMLEYFREIKDEDVTAAFFNMKGVRADFKVPEGGKLNMTVGDIYAVAPFNNTWLLYDLTGEELAQQIVNGWKSSDMGDQVTGLTFEYRDIGTKDKPDIEVVSITLDDGTVVDIHGKKPIYRVIVSNYNATIENSVFIDKTPIYPEAGAPIDNQAIIELLRDRRDRGKEHIPVDRTPRGSEVTENMKEAA